MSNAGALREHVQRLNDAGMPTNRIALEQGVPSARIEDWMAGEDAPDIEREVTKWMADFDRASHERSGAFVNTDTSMRIQAAFDGARKAQDANGARGLALAFGLSGAGKTITARHYVERHNSLASNGLYQTFHAIYVQASGEVNTFAEIIAAVAEDMGPRVAHVIKKNRLKAICADLLEGSIIIVDDAHLLDNMTKVMDQMRATFCDQKRIAVAFMGNTAGGRALLKAKMAQLTSRVGGNAVIAELPSEKDVNHLLNSEGLSGPEYRSTRDELMLIGRQDGGLRTMMNVIARAKDYAKYKGVAITPDLIQVIGVQCNAYGFGFSEA